MKPLTKEEIQFIKETGWTPTVQQVGEWNRTIFAKEFRPKDLSIAEQIYDEESFNSFNDAIRYAHEKYNIDLEELYNKCVNEYDCVTLENDATYLFYTFFTKEELEKLTDEEATKWLKDFKYHCGYRKWDGGSLGCVDDAIAVYNNEALFYTDKEGNVWYFDEEPHSSEVFTKLKMEK